VSPVFEVGGAGLNATPWNYPSWAVNDFRDSVVLHYELFPYLYGLAGQAARTGVPILRAVGFQYPADQTAWAQDQEFMIGPDLLAAPVTADRAQADGSAGRATPVSVYLPAGRWVNLFTGQAYSGGRTVTESAGLDEFPLYLRAGAAIGFNARTPGVWSDGWGPDDLAKPGLAGWLYAPDGSGAQVRLVLRDAPSHAQVLVLTSHPPRSVTVNGLMLPRAADAAALRGVSAGWTFSPGAFGGVMVKVSSPGGTVTVQIAS
jgi:alpha-D-xyloside xylohydrolase